MEDSGVEFPNFENGECCEVETGFRVSFRQPPRPPFPLLFSDALSDYHLARVDNEPLPSTLLQRQVVLAASLKADEWWFAPLKELSPGPYTLLKSPTEWWLLDVVPASRSRFQRIWPADSLPTRFAVFCSDTAPRGASFTLPSGLSPLAIPGSNHCFGLLAEPGLGETLTPARLFDADVEATILSGVLAPPFETSAPLSCDDTEFRFGLGCARVSDDRVLFRVASDSYWLVTGAASLGTAARADGVTVLKGLQPQRRQSLRVQIFLRSGEELLANPEVETSASEPHLVINEVMANPLGPEPQQEWVEIVNDGSSSIELEGFRFGDGGFDEATVLPALLLAPGAFVVLARPDYDSLATWDAVPTAETPLLRVEPLGKSGLSNSGEPLSLMTPGGRVVSRFPPLAAKPSLSLARRFPWCPDEDLSCFGTHAASEEGSGASPGAANRVEE